MNADPGLLARRREPRVPQLAHQDRRVLVAEDDPAVLRSFARAMSSAGFDVALAASCAECLRLDAAHQRLVLDIELGDGCGVELAHQLLARSPDRRIVFVTGCLDWERLSRASELGSVLRKPTGLREVLRVLDGALPSRGETR